MLDDGEVVIREYRTIFNDERRIAKYNRMVMEVITTITYKLIDFIDFDVTDEILIQNPYFFGVDTFNTKLSKYNLLKSNAEKNCFQELQETYPNNIVIPNYPLNQREWKNKSTS